MTPAMSSNYVMMVHAATWFLLIMIVCAQPQKAPAQQYKGAPEAAPPPQASQTSAKSGQSGDQNWQPSAQNGQSAAQSWQASSQVTNVAQQQNPDMPPPPPQPLHPQFPASASALLMGSGMH